MVDQEGGAVQRPPGPPSASAAQMGELGPDYARRQGAAPPASLLSYGINVDLAPVLDLGRSGSAIAAEGRTFGPTPETVTSSGVDGFAAGLREGGVAATAKHFPGLGGATPTPTSPPRRSDLGARTLRAEDAAPFEALRRRRRRAVMLGLASYPALGDRPAAFEPAIATGELRERIGFDGVSITDSLDAVAAQAFGDRDRVALAAAGAGSDLLLYGDWRTARDVAATLTRALREGRLDRAAFEDSVRRVLELRSGLATGPNPLPDQGTLLVVSQVLSAESLFPPPPLQRSSPPSPDIESVPSLPSSESSPSPPNRSSLLPPPSISSAPPPPRMVSSPMSPNSSRSLASVPVILSSPM